MKILLCCDGGFSTSLVASKMKEEAQIQNVEHTIWAINVNNLKNEIGKADVVLIGPHMAYRRKEVEGLASKTSIPVNVIDALDYGRCNGKNVLALAVKTVAEYQK